MDIRRIRHSLLILRYFIAFSIQFLALNSKGQELIVSFRIVDFEKRGIPYASVSLGRHQIGTYSDSLGNVIFRFPKEKADSLHINAVGYQSKSIFYVDYPKTITLQEDNSQIEAIEVKSKRTSFYRKRIGEFHKGFKKHQFTLNGVKGTQYAFYLANEEKKEGIIKTIYINTKTEKINPTNKIRIRFYTQNQFTKAPDKDITDKNIIYEVSKSGVLSINIEDYKIICPKDGFFVGIDLMGNEKSEIKSKVSPTIYGYSPRLKNDYSQGYWTSFMDNKKWFSSNKFKGRNTGSIVLYISADIKYDNE